MTISEIISFLNESGIKYYFDGNMKDCIDGFSSISHYRKGTMTWLKSKRSIADNSFSEIDLLVKQQGISGHGKNTIETDRSKEVFFRIIERFFYNKEKCIPIGENTVIGENVRIGKNVEIGNNCSILGDISIGNETTIGNNVSIKNRVAIQSNCVIQDNVSIGNDGFGYYSSENNSHIMIKHFGGVNIGKDVFIGSNTNIARGTIDDTEIGNDTKIDALCHIAHNVVVGKNVTLIAGTMLYGSCKVLDNAYIASAIVMNQITIGENAVVGMGSVCNRNVKNNEVVVGVPAREIKR